MKMFSLSVYPTTLPKASAPGTFSAALGTTYRHPSVGKTLKAVNILHKISRAFQQIISAGSAAVLDLLNGHAAGHQHIYAPVAHQPLNGTHTASKLIRFSNGRSPYPTKQVIF